MKGCGCGCERVGHSVLEDAMELASLVTQSFRELLIVVVCESCIRLLLLLPLTVLLILLFVNGEELRSIVSASLATRNVSSHAAASSRAL